jgi:hypothetical protein
MSIQGKKVHSALKHGAYSATALLPSEDEDAFRQLHQQIIAELAPVGALEDDIVATIVRLLWRKQNLATLRIAEVAREHDNRIRARKLSSFRTQDWPDIDDVTPAQREAAVQAAEEQARKELGDRYALVEIGEAATLGHLLKDLQVEERLDAMIDKCLKRLLFLRGVKSLSSAASSAPPQPVAEPPRIPGPKKVA